MSSSSEVHLLRIVSISVSWGIEIITEETVVVFNSFVLLSFEAVGGFLREADKAAFRRRKRERVKEREINLWMKFNIN